jgi:hypothetical protein
MRILPLALSLAALMPSAARADEAKDIMRQAAIEQAETSPPPQGPATEASATAKSRADGQQGRTEREAHAAASAEAHRAAVTAARSAATGAATAASAGGGSATARSASVRNNAADSAQRGAAGVARERAVRGGHGPPPGGGRP